MLSPSDGIGAKDHIEKRKGVGWPGVVFYGLRFK
jgi:hypothetical protein